MAWMVAAQVDRLGKFKMQIFGFKHIGALFDEVVTMETLNIVFFFTYLIKVSLFYIEFWKMTLNM